MPAKEDKGDAVLAICFIRRGYKGFYISSKAEHFGYKVCGHSVVKGLIED